jgi:hypothetical protein
MKTMRRLLLAAALVLSVAGAAWSATGYTNVLAALNAIAAALGTPMQASGGSVTANAGTNLNTSALALDTTVGTTNTDIGPPGATACATDNGSCSLNALLQRIAQRATSILTALGTPMQQTGGTVGLVAGSAVVGHIIDDTGCNGATAANTFTTPINNAGSATAQKIITGVTAQKIYICAINIGPVGGGENLALVEGTTTTNPCDTSTLGLAGGATAATGWILPTNGGLAYGNGRGLIAKTTVNANHVCLFYSAAVQVSGVITWAQF